MAEKKKILYIVEAMGGGVFTYIVDLANELVNKYDMYIAYLYRTSYRLNSECKQAIREAIADNYDGMYLGDDAVNQVVRQYGMKRVGYILANTLHHALRSLKAKKQEQPAQEQDKPKKAKKKGISKL